MFEPMSHKCGKCGTAFECPGEPCGFSVMHNLCSPCMHEYAREGKSIPLSYRKERP